MKLILHLHSLKYSLLTILFLFSEFAFSQSQEAIMLGNWDDTSLPLASFIGNRYNDIWGIEVNGVEYAVIGSCNGTHFIDIDNPNGPTEVAFAPGGHQGPAIIHRDFHSYQHYIYTVADEGNGSTLQVIDFSNLPNSVETVYDSNEFFTTSHNVFIDEENARLYTTEGINVLSLEDPTQPVFLDNLNSNGLSVPSYSHDIFVRDNILYMNCGNNGFYIVDYNDVNNPIPLGSMTSYPQSGYNHSGWLSDDGMHYFLCDETHGRDVKSVSVSDLSDIHVVDLFNSESNSPDHIAHNAMVRGDLLFVSYYYDGLQVFDISDPENVFRKYHFDTYPLADDDFFHGAWGVYALLPSGRILLSDMQTGLYVFELPSDVAIYGSQSSFTSCVNETINFDLNVGTGFSANGVNITVAGVPSGVTVDFVGDMVDPGSVVNINVTGLSSADIFDLTFTADDGTETATQIIPFTIAEILVPITLGVPADASTEIALAPFFSWQTTSGISSYLLEISTSSDFAAGNVVVAEAVTSSPFAITNGLDANTLYYWRLTSSADCAGSEVYSFTTENTINTFAPDKNDFWVYPNPAKESVHVQLLSNDGGMVDIQLHDITGRLIQEWATFAENDLRLELPANLSGLYLLSVKNDNGKRTKRIVVE